MGLAHCMHPPRFPSGQRDTVRYDMKHSIQMYRITVIKKKQKKKTGMCLKSEAHRIGFQDPIPPRSARAPRWRPKAEANQPASVSSRKMTNNVTNTSSAEDRGPAISIKEERGFCKRWAGHRQDELYQAD